MKPLSRRRSFCPRALPSRFRRLLGETLEPRALLAALPPADLVSWYRAENNASDFADGNHGTLEGGAGFAPGKSGRAFDLDGQNDYINVPDRPNLNFSSAVTYDAWFNARSHLKLNINMILGKSVNAGGQGREQLGIWLNRNGTIQGRAETLIGQINVIGPVVPNNNWHHTALSFDGTSLRLYLNGSQVAVETFPSTTLRQTTDPLRIGCDYDRCAFPEPPGNVGTDYLFNGLIDEVHLFNRALSPAEIQSIFAAGSEGLATQVVTTALDAVDPADGLTSLREAIIAANASVGDRDVIGFDIPGSDPGHVYYKNDGVPGQVTLANVTATTSATDAAIADIDPDWPHSWFTIRPTSPLPDIADPLLTIDGYTQPGSIQNTNPTSMGLNSVLKIEINGEANENHGDSGTGLLRFAGAAAGYSIVQGLVLNRAINPTTSVPVLGLYGEFGNYAVEGNYIGTDVSGTHGLLPARPGGFFGSQFILLGTNDSSIGGTTPAARNLLSDIVISASVSTGRRNRIAGNLIGTDRSGSSKSGGGGVIGGVDTVIGGTDLSSRNVIAQGLSLTGSGNLVQNNLIGTDITVTKRLSQLGVGRFGIAVTGHENRIVKNTVAFHGDILGGIAEGGGIRITGSRNQVLENTIHSNIGVGISVGGLLGPAPEQNLISQNSIFDNAGIGIDLVKAGDNVTGGVTPNDAGDADDGPNRLQNFPELASASLSTGMLALQYVVSSSTENSSYPLRIEFFKADADGQEGQTFLGFDNYEASEAGTTATIVLAPLAALAVGDKIVATATDNFGIGNTSEFSESITIQDSGCRLVVHNMNAANLDASFDGDGKVITALSSSDDWLGDVAVQRDGKIVVAGSAFNGSNDDFAVVRYNADGSLDTSFGANGKVLTDFGTLPRGDERGTSVALQGDGKIVVAGITYGGFAVVRYNLDGSLDTSFDGDGKVITVVGSTAGAAFDVVVQADGKIVAAGLRGEDYNNDFALVRYNSDGSLDTSFDGDGIVTTQFGSTSDIAYSVAVQADGRIVAAGHTNESSDVFALARYNRDGSLDTSFGGDGKVTTAFRPSQRAYARSIALQNDGRIVAAGWADAEVGEEFAIARYNIDGTLDSSFDGDGKQTTDFDTDGDFGNGVAVQTNGKIVVVGSSLTGTLLGIQPDFALVRYNSDGSLDSTFDGDGKLITRLSTHGDTAFGVALQPDGKIIAAGVNGSDNGYDFAVARYVGDLVLVVNNTGDRGPGSLRDAINCANEIPGADTIAFNIPGSGVQTISPLTPLPTITDPVVIDGYTQPGASPNTNPFGEGLNTVLMVELNGQNAGQNAVGLAISAGGSTVRGLVINRFGGDGISPSVAGANEISGNFIGTDQSGKIPFGNGGSGVRLASGANLIGGLTAASRNVISFNNVHGIEIRAGSGNVIQGNYLGPDMTGAILGNEGTGDNRGNRIAGVAINGGSSNTIGGLAPNAGNIIGGNNSGIQDAYHLTSGNIFHGNFIGVTPSGAPIGNSIAMLVGTNATVGGRIPGAGNVISSNGSGLAISGTGNVVQGNFIGTNAEGANLGNHAIGIQILRSNNLIGGTEPGAGNVIANSGNVAISIAGNFEGPPVGNAVLGNSISSNRFGIDLGFDGVTPNDLADADAGPNNLQNFPVLTEVTITADTAISGTLNSLAGASFHIEFFANTAADPSGFGEGQTLLGALIVATDSSGDASFTFHTPTLVPLGQFITATATRLADHDSNPTTPLAPVETSEFSAAMLVRSPWHNYAVPLDVDDSGGLTPVSSIDALIIFNLLNANQGGGNIRVPDDAEIGDPFFYDVNNDFFVSAIDALRVINFLNTQPGGNPEGESTITVPDLDNLFAVLAADADDARRRRRGK